MKPTLAVTGMLLTAGLLLAHHSWGGVYDLQKQVILRGKVSNIAFKNPHVILTIETKDSGTWQSEMTSIEGLQRMGISDGTLKVGDFLEIVGSPSLDPQRRVVAALWEIRRPADGAHWTWQEWPGPRIIE